MSTGAHRTEEPHDRLTRLCDAMTQALDAHPETSPDVKGVIMLQDGDRGGLVLYGYDDDVEAIADLFMHLKAIFEANGKTLMLTSIGGDG